MKNCLNDQKRNLETGKCRKKSPYKSKSQSKSPSKSPSKSTQKYKDNIYCGNNLLNSELVSGIKKLGTRYKCMQKGIGYGLYCKNKEKYNQNYEPIDKRKFYCGNKEILPTEYSDFGNLNQCFYKGFVLGQKIKNKEQDDKSQPK